MFVSYKCHILIELTFIKESMLIKEVHQKCDTCHYCFFLSYSFKFQPNVCNRYDILLMVSMNPSDIAIFWLLLYY